MAGYSGTSLNKKLGIQPGFTIYVQNAPEKYLTLVAPLPPAVVFTKKLKKELDMIHLFTSERAILEESLSLFLDKIAPDGMIWVSWPKQASKVPTDITEDTIREIALPLGLVDVKVCAIDEVWSGLKLVVRVKHRKP